MNLTQLPFFYCTNWVCFSSLLKTYHPNVKYRNFSVRYSDFYGNTIKSDKWALFIKLTVALLTYKFKSCKVINFYSIIFVLLIFPLRVEWKNCSYILLFHVLFMVLGEKRNDWYNFVQMLAWPSTKTKQNRIFSFRSSQRIARVSQCILLVICCFEQEHLSNETDFSPEYKRTLPFSINGERQLHCNGLYFVVFQGPSFTRHLIVSDSQVIIAH